MKKILAVSSGKGGVGKTWFTVSLSCALARSRRRVLLVDCDIGLANVDIQLGMTKEAGITDVVMGRIPLDRVIRSVDDLGIDVLPGRSGGSYIDGLDPLIVGWLHNELRSLRDVYDIILLDLPSGTHQGVRDMMRYADQNIIITTDEPTALVDAYALIKSVGNRDLDNVPKIIVNFAENAAAGHQTLAGLKRVCRRFLTIEPESLGIIRRDRRVPEAIGRQMALLQCYPGSDAAQDVAAVAEALDI